MSETVDWQEAPISRAHDRMGFDCGVENLNTYLQRYARQNHVGGGAKTFVAAPTAEPTRILGYYSISPGKIEFASVPGVVSHGLGHYDVPVFRLARLAVDRSVQGLGYGSTLFALAATRAICVSELVGGVALAIDAINAQAAAWYERHGALRLLDDPLKLVLPLSTIAAADRQTQ